MIEAPFSVKEKILVYLAAEGFVADEISRAVDLPVENVNSMLLEQNVQVRIRDLRAKLYSKDVTKRFNAMLPGAEEVLKEVLENPNAKVEYRMRAAQEVFDRALGKPKQTVEHEGGLLRSVFERLDEQKNGRIIDVEVTEAELPALSNPNLEKKQPQGDNPNFQDPIDAWVNKNT